MSRPRELRLGLAKRTTMPERAGTQARLIRARGFTLLEVLVVMALIALAMGVVLPRTAGWLDSVQERGWRADLRAHVEGLPVRAFLSGEEIRLIAPQLLAAVPGAPPGVTLRLPEPLVYGATGAAGGGRLQIDSRGASEEWLIEPVSGRVTGAR